MKKKDLKVLEDALKLTPNNIALRLTYALKLFKLRDFEQSETNYQEVLKKDPSNIKAKQGLVELYFAKGNYSAVIVIAEELVKVGAASEKMMELYAKALLRQNNISEAQEIYDRIIKNNPFYFDEELDAVLEDEDEYLHDDEYDGMDSDFEDEEMDNMFDNPFFADDDYMFIENGTVKWRDVIGMDQLKRLIDYNSVILTPELGYKHRNNKVNLLLFGPPGCGKTHLVSAIPDRFDASILPMELDRINDAFTFKAEGRIQFYFAKLRLHPSAILFIDDVEKYGSKREKSGSFEALQVYSKLAEELDGIRYKDSAQFVIAATNQPWELDPSLFTPGKFTGRCFVAPPTLSERVKYFEHMKAYHTMTSVEVSELAMETRMFSYAELSCLIDTALFHIATKSGKKKSKLGFQDLMKVVPTIRPFALTWFEEFDQKAPEHMKYEVDQYLQRAD
ncbi:MAG: AAA family ATPase [Saprospiraceae bacterium]|nr:AAA family ATPase [Saprospiraceae bacterium]